MWPRTVGGQYRMPAFLVLMKKKSRSLCPCALQPLLLMTFNLRNAMLSRCLYLHLLPPQGPHHRQRLASLAVHLYTGPVNLVR